MKRSNLVRILVFTSILAVVVAILVFNQQSKPVSPNEFKLTINNKDYKLQIANTQQKRLTGLMFKSKEEVKDGMLFIFPDSQIRTFWMKNTYTALDILFLDSEWRIVNFVQNTKTDQILETYSSKNPAKFVVELPAGTILANQITLTSRLVPEYSINALN